MARIAMVAGAAGDLSVTLARRLAGDGMDIAVLGRDEDACARAAAQASALGPRATAVAVNPADADSVQAALAQVGRALGTPTVLLNDVGAELCRPVSDMSSQDWDACVADCLRAAFVLSRAALDPMIKMGWGRIVTVVGNRAAGHHDLAGNLTVRAGLAGFTRALALEVEPLGITANLVVAGLSGDDSAMVGTALGDAASFLLSDGAAVTTGQIVHVAGSSDQAAPIGAAAN